MKLNVYLHTLSKQEVNSCLKFKSKKVSLSEHVHQPAQLLLNVHVCVFLYLLLQEVLHFV